MKYLLLLILLIPNFAKSATVLEVQDVAMTNLLKNPGFENGIARWTPSVSSTVSQVTGALALLETKSLLFTATAASQTIQSALYTLPTGLVNGNCESSILYQTNSSVYSMRVLNASGAVLSQQALPAVSNAVTAKMFFPCSVSSTTSIRSDLISSATASGNGITWDQNHLGSLISVRNGAVVEGWTAYTPATAGFGTITAADFFYRRVGDSIQIKARFTAGTTAATIGSVSLPSGFVIDPVEVPNIRPSGVTFRSLVSPNVMTTVLVSGSATVLNFSGIVISQTINPFTPANVSIFLTTGETFSFETGMIPISGLQGSGVTFNAECPNAISCTNEFSAKISSTAVVTDENLDFLNTCSVLSAGNFSCNFNSGIFTAAPNCTATSNRNGASDNTIRFNTISTSGVSYTIGRDGVSDSSGPIIIKCSKSTDFKATQEIKGYMSDTVTHGAVKIPRIVKGEYFTTTAGTVCSASPCTITGSDPAITSVTRTGTGDYTINFVAGTFSAKPLCFFSLFQTTAANLSVVFNGAFQATNTASAYRFNTTNGNNNSVQNTSSEFMCIGPM